MDSRTQLTISNTILQGAFIEEVRGELSQLRVHAVLDSESEGSNAKNDQALKQGLGEASTRGLFTHHHRPQLAVIPHQNHLFGPQDNLWKNMKPEVIVEHFYILVST